MKRDIKISDINIKLLKEEIKELAKVRDGFLLASFILLCVAIIVDSSGTTSSIKLACLYIVDVVFWLCTFLINKLLTKVEKYRKSLFIRPALDEDDK